MTLKGVDLSDHNGKPDFNLVSKSGIDFCMIRMGYGGDIPSQDDKQFENSVAECERLGIKWGAYLYSYALNVDDAKSEVQHALRLLRRKTPDFPIAFDMEDADGYKAKHGMPSKEVLVDICDTFLGELEKEGYYVMLYASKSWLETLLNSSKLNRYDKWVAEWSSNCSYKEPYHMWQYFSRGKVNGIYGQVDMDEALIDFSHYIHKNKYSTYTVKNGDTLSLIANDHNTTVQSILKINPQITNENLIIPKQKIKLP